MDKPNAGDTAVLKSGEKFVIREVKDRHPEHTLPQKFQWYVTGDAPNEHGVWDQYIDHIIPAQKPALQKGDKVRLTPNDGGETVIVGEVHADWSDVLDLTPDGTIAYIAIQKREWNIENVTPSTEEILNGLGENAFVAHRTHGYVHGYFKRHDVWHTANRDNQLRTSSQVSYYIDNEGFEIIFEGVPSE